MTIFEFPKQSIPAMEIEADTEQEAQAMYREAVRRSMDVTTPKVQEKNTTTK